MNGRAVAQDNSPRQSSLRARDVVSRICAAIFGGYVAASALSVLVARLLPLQKVGATTTAILLTAPLYLCVILSAFAARSPSRAWVIVSTVAVAAGASSWGIIAWSGRG